MSNYADAMELPEGLYICRACGTPRGTTPHGTTATCLCAAVPCRHCDAGWVRRPLRDWYHADSGRWLHTPYFGSVKPCPACITAGRGPKTGTYGERRRG
jgi:hypothetical protein